MSRGTDMLFMPKVLKVSRFIFVLACVNRCVKVCSCEKVLVSSAQYFKIIHLDQNDQGQIVWLILSSIGDISQIDVILDSKTLFSF